MSDATSIFGHYETESAMVTDIRLAILAVVKQLGEPTSQQIAELVAELVVIPLLMEFHE
jgi:hypothetical protein